MINLHEAYFNIEFHGGKFDIWRLYGKCENHPRFADGDRISPSPPISFNEQDLTFKTSSGSEYKIVSFEENKEKVIQSIKNCVKIGKYELVG